MSPYLSHAPPPAHPIYDFRALLPPPIDHCGYSGVALLETSYHDVAHLERQHALAQEIAALECIGTWDHISLPPRAHPITCKWVYKVKTLMVSLEHYRLILWSECASSLG